MNGQNFYCARFYVTYRCNSRCSYCNVWQNPAFKNVPELSAEDACLLVKQCREHGVRYIDFTGGEPTLYPHLAEVIEYAKKLGIKTEVTSNCIASASKRKMLEVAFAADKFNTSLDTLNSAAYRQIRGIDACENVKKTVAEIASVRAPKIMTVVTDGNINELDNMISYAQRHHALIYLSPMFPYMDKGGTYRISAYISDIVNRIFDAYTVVLLHFMEFFRTSSPSQLPPCSANRHTLTFAPDGSLVLPCYHAVSENVAWNKDLNAALESAAFRRSALSSGTLETCRGCCVIPYFGISFNYQLNKYFLLQSFSEKLYHLKRDCLNPLLDILHPDRKHLLQELETMQEVVRSLACPPDMEAYRRNGASLYPVEKTPEGFASPLYKQPLPPEVYDRESRAADCWQLTLVPHHYFDKVCNGIFRPIASALSESGAEANSPAVGLLRDSMEFAVRWWRFYTATYFRLSRPYDTTLDSAWLSAFLRRMETLEYPDAARIAAEGKGYLPAADEKAKVA